MTGIPDVAIAREWAWFYRSLGLNPLPSSRRRKLPAIAKREGGPGYARFWLDTYPARGWLASGARNIQVPCGVRWGLAVVDLDGPEAIAAWEAMTLFRENPPTWTVLSGSGVGLHRWYVVPEGTSEIRKRLLWGIWDESTAKWVRSSRVELLGDRSLCVAPPSVHVETGRRYRFLPGRSPADLRLPAVLPSWVLSLPPCEPPGRAASSWTPDRGRPNRTTAPSCGAAGLPSGLRYRLDDVDQAVRPHRLPIVRGWGLRVARERPNARGFVPCHAIGREDRDPSASFDPDRGYYSEVDGPCYPFFLLGQVLGAYPDWRACVNDLGDHFGCRQRGSRAGIHRTLQPH